MLILGAGNIDGTGNALANNMGGGDGATTSSMEVAPGTTRSPDYGGADTLIGGGGIYDVLSGVVTPTTLCGVARATTCSWATPAKTSCKAAPATTFTRSRRAATR